MLFRTNAAMSGIIFLACQLLFSPNVQAGTDNHIYSGDLCQPDGSGDGPLSHVRGTSYFTSNSITGLSAGGWVDCPVPRAFKGITAKSNLTVKVAVHDSGNNDTTTGGVGVDCELESRPLYSTLNAVLNNYLANTVLTGGTAVEKDAILTLSVKPIDSNGHYRILCYLPPDTATSVDKSRIYSYETLESN
jgi:hypothetical protein